MRAHVVARHRRGAGANSDGHDYFASMTDLMLGLVFVFIIVLMAVALNLRQSAQIESPPAPAAAALLSDITEADLARRDLLNDIARILNNALPVTVDEANGSLQLGGDVLFPTGSADAYSDALPKLRLLAKALAQVLPCYAVAADAAAATSCDIRHKGRLDAVYIEGHTDTTPIHTARFQSNWDLSAARASETFKLLVATFPTLATLKNDHAESLIGVSGYGEYRPIDTAGTATALQRNRRIELRFIMATPSPNAVTGLLDRVKDERAR